MPGSQLARSELGLRLETARKRARKTQADVAEARIFGLSKLREIERGIRAEPGDVWTLCRFYEIAQNETSELIHLADMAKSEGFWEDSREAVPGWFELYLACERQCSKLSYWHPELAPGVLQTADYAAAVVSADGVNDPAVLRTRLKLRGERQRALLDRRDRDIEVVLGPGAFELKLGGRQVAAAQRATLHELNSAPASTFGFSPASQVHIRVWRRGSRCSTSPTHAGPPSSTWKRSPEPGTSKGGATSLPTGTPSLPSESSVSPSRSSYDDRIERRMDQGDGEQRRRRLRGDACSPRPHPSSGQQAWIRQPHPHTHAI